MMCSVYNLRQDFSLSYNALLSILLLLSLCPYAIFHVTNSNPATIYSTSLPTWPQKFICCSLRSSQYPCHIASNMIYTPTQR